MASERSEFKSCCSTTTCAIIFFLIPGLVISLFIILKNGNVEFLKFTNDCEEDIAIENIVADVNESFDKPPTQLILDNFTPHGSYGKES